MGGIIDGIKWGVLLQLGVTIILPMVTGMLGHMSGGGGGHQQGGRPYGYDSGEY